MKLRFISETATTIRDRWSEEKKEEEKKKKKRRKQEKNLTEFPGSPQQPHTNRMHPREPKIEIKLKLKKGKLNKRGFGWK